MAQKIVGIRFMEFIKKVILPTISSILLGVMCILPLHYFMEESFLRVAVVSIVYLIIYTVLAWFFVFDSEVKNMVRALKSKFF